MSSVGKNHGFSSEVLKLAKRIPKGKVSTYSDIARALGKPKAFRAVGGALRRNPKPIKVSCHRVVRSDGSVGKYSGKSSKEKLLRSEGVEVVNGRVNLEKFRAALQS